MGAALVKATEGRARLQRCTELASESTLKTKILVALCVLLAGAGVYAYTQIPMIAAGGLLYPMRHAAGGTAPDGCADAEFSGADVTLRGWRCLTMTTRPRGTIVYLHGVADNRASAAGALKHFIDNGFDAIAYDSRAHGDSTGEVCTYGYHEKQDLRRVIDTITGAGVVVMGHSLGAAVALQAAAEDERIDGVVAIESFSDLRTIARERAFFLPQRLVDQAFRYAEERGQFKADAVSPVAAAARIHVPVLVIHGKEDDATAPRHSERIFEALAGPKRLLLVDGAHHNQSMQPDVWVAVDRWIDQIADGVAAREVERELALGPSEPAPEWIDGRPARTLADELAELTIPAPRALADDLDRNVRRFSHLTWRGATWIAYEAMEGKYRAAELRVGRFDARARTWRTHRVEFPGGFEWLSTRGNFVLGTGRVSPSAGLVMVIDEEARQPPEVLFGFGPLLVPGGLVYDRGMVHFAPTHPASVGWFDAEIVQGSIAISAEALRVCSAGIRPTHAKSVRPAPEPRENATGSTTTAIPEAVRIERGPNCTSMPTAGRSCSSLGFGERHGDDTDRRAGGHGNRHGFLWPVRR